MADIRQTPEYANYLSKIGWEVERIKNVNYFIKKFPLIGSVIKIQRPETINNKSINQLASKYRAFQIIIEPLLPATSYILQKNGFRLSNSPYLPTKTLQLDLTKSENQLLKDMKKDCRSAIKKSMNYDGGAGYSLCTMDSVEDFRDSWKKAVGWKRYVPPLSHLIALKTSFKENCLCLLEENKNSGAIFLLADGISYYWQAFTDSEGRKSQAQYKIVWEGILWTKKMGAKIFDLEGIYDERFPNKSWLGFTHFKKSFGGYEVEYPGAYEKFVLPFTK